MKTINFGVAYNNLYHTIKYRDVFFDDTLKIKKGFCKITGFTKEDIQLNDELIINNTSYEVI